MAFEYNERTNSIACPRNNNGSITVTVDGMELSTGDVVAFYIRDPARSRKLVELVQEPVDGVCTFTLDSGNTELIPPGRYKWNIRIVTSPRYDADGRLTIAEDGANSITLWNNPPDFVVLEV